MSFNPLQCISTALRASSSRLLPLLRPSLTPIASRSASYVSLHSLKEAPGSSKNLRRRGRGHASGKGGHTTGRGQKGAGARGTGVPYRGFEGGQTPLAKTIPKHGYINFTRKEYAPLNIAALQKWIADKRIDPTEPITIHKCLQANLIHGTMSKKTGVKLLGEPNPDLPLPPLDVQLSKYSETAAKAIIAAGGKCLAIYHNKLGMRAEVFPQKFVGREIRQARPVRRTDIEYYTNPAKYGYLAENKEEFFKERGYDPEKRRRRFQAREAEKTEETSGAAEAS